MPQPAQAVLKRARQLFYTVGGPWYRCRLFELFGSERYSRPALFGMDRRLAELMPWQAGTFVEAGAHDGYTQSNTYYLERFRNWSGLLVEPVPALAGRCQRRRSSSSVVGCALVGPEYQGDRVRLAYDDLMSAVTAPGCGADGDPARAERGRSRLSVPARTLSSVLSDAGMTNIDLLVLDVEGNEAEVLAGLDMERYSPRFLLVEVLDRASQQPLLDRALVPHYELQEALSDFDLLYRRSD